jgi:hypothetical protein
LKKIEPLFKGTLSYKKVITILRPILRKFRSKPLLLLANIEKNQCSVGGVYDTQAVRLPIAVEILFSSNSDEIKMPMKYWRNFLFNVFETIIHEHIHLCQMSCRSGDEWAQYHPLDDNALMTDQQSYLSELDEIDAYGHNIALEILYQYPKDDPFKILSDLKNRGIESYDMYLIDFNGTKWTDIRNDLLRKTYKWLNLILDNDWGWMEKN